MRKIIPITLITGYLGSGKTTLLNYILKNKENFKVAVIVNDIGEINIDANLIAKDNVVSQGDNSLVALQNGCICCTLQKDLLQQLQNLMSSGKFDYIIIEASGVCEPLPIVQTIEVLKEYCEKYRLPIGCKIDNVVTVVDALRLSSEFGNGENLLKENIDEEDIENLIISQIEFCNKIILNKIDKVSEDEKQLVKAVIKKLQPEAEILEAEYSVVPVSKIVETNVFDFDKAAMSAGWMKELDKVVEENDEEHEHHHHDDEEEHEHHHHDDEDEHEHHHHDDEDEHEHHHHHDDEEEHGHHHHHHHHHHEGGETEEFGIGSFVYFRRKPLDNEKFEEFLKTLPRNVIRSKGIVWFGDDNQNMYIFEQAGSQKDIYLGGLFVAAFPRLEREMFIKENPDIQKEWDEEVGDRMVKIVFIGQKMDKEQIIKSLDECLIK